LPLRNIFLFFGWQYFATVALLGNSSRRDYIVRTAADFDAFYANADPWRIEGARSRDKILRRSVAHFVTGKTVLELGCGEGHLTQTLFWDAARVKGIDISGVAIDRAISREMPNASFETSDFLSVPFTGYDVITAIECLYYLSVSEQNAFFEKVAHEHSKKLLIISAPIIGQNEHRRYFTHKGMLNTLAQHGISVIEFHNVNVDRKTPLANRTVANLAAALVRVPLGDLLLDALPDRLIYQRCYIAC
jgi:2-polyprenyl-3-methyl-5-hydroxy-6-metoxy-1,4-benzoquinol methylase